MGCYVKNDCVKLEKISHIYKYLFIEKGLRGGIFYIAKIYAKANNKYMNDYDPKSSQHLYHTLTWIIYMVGKLVTIFLMKSLNG